MLRPVCGHVLISYGCVLVTSMMETDINLLSGKAFLGPFESGQHVSGAAISEPHETGKQNESCCKWISAEAGVKKIWVSSFQRVSAFCEIGFTAQQYERMHEEAVPNPKCSQSPRTVAHGFQALRSNSYRLTDAYQLSNSNHFLIHF